VNGFGQLGVDCVNPNNPGARPQDQAMLNDKVDKLQASDAELTATVGKQQKEMEVLTTRLKEQAAQIQKVSAQLEVSKPAPQVVTNKP
jgi:septal ring factor EnvC (AmiA/AmiB activator)